jgi:glutathione peroxidase
MSKTVYDFSATDINHKEVKLSEYKGKVLLIVNVASQCGFTPQYKGLEQLQREFGDKFAVLGFPCNQFGKQEPGDENEIKNFCSLNYNVTFPLFSKIDVNGSATHPLYEFLKEEKKGLLGTEAIKWNFTKFLIDKNGNVVKRYAPTDSPESLKNEIQKLIK